MKKYGGVEVFLTSPLLGGESTASRPCRFTPGERLPGTLRIGGWEDSQQVWMIWRSENS
jgi:hypothetical protein